MISFASGLASNSNAHQFTWDIIFGGDTNPIFLDDSFETSVEAYNQSRFEFSHDAKDGGIYYTLKGDGSQFADNDEPLANSLNGDKILAKAALGWDWRPEFDYGEGQIKIELNYDHFDNVFVDRTTGRLARFNGVEVSDRFDYSAPGFLISTVIPLSEEADFILEIDGNDRSYEDYNLPGLANLDFQEVEIDLGFEKLIWPRTLVRTMIGAGKRIYVDRRGRADDGTIIADSELEFSYLEVENSIDFAITNRWHWITGFDIDQRKDSEGGYYDVTEGEFFTRIRYLNNEYVDFYFDVSYFKREYDNTDYNDFFVFEDEQKEREGYGLRAELVRNIIGRGWDRMDLIIGISADSFENEDPVYTYDRGQAYVGIRWRPY
ncbi:hypothetical protein NBRC116492_16580 [Aurantivibrio infirmus]